MRNEKRIKLEVKNQNLKCETRDDKRKTKKEKQKNEEIIKKSKKQGHDESHPC